MERSMANPAKDKIVTQCICPPIPTKEYDWLATLSFYDGDEGPQGYGETEEAAILDLLQNAIDFEGDGSAQEVIVELAYMALKPDTTEGVENVKPSI